MILELAILKINHGQQNEFELAFGKVQFILSAMPGYISHQLQRCLETPGKYVLLVYWQRLEDHTIGFRQSASYQEWKRLLHHFYDPFPTVEYFESVFEGGAGSA